MAENYFYKRIGQKNIAAAKRDGHTNIFYFDDESQSEAIRAFGNAAHNPEFTMNLTDSVVLTLKVKRELQKILASENNPKQED